MISVGMEFFFFLKMSLLRPSEKLALTWLLTMHAVLCHLVVAGLQKSN